MRLRLTCKSCGTAIVVDARHAGKTGRCPNAACGESIQVPSTRRRPSTGQTVPQVPAGTPSLPPRRAGRAGSTGTGGSRTTRSRSTGRRQTFHAVIIAAVVAASAGTVLLYDAFSPATTPAAGNGSASATLKAGEPPVAEERIEDPVFKETMVPFLQKYCIDCHGPDYAEADIDFSAFDSVASMQSDRKKWNQILGIIRIGAMPPVEHEPQPPMEVRRIVSDWLDVTLNHVDCEFVDDPGRVTIRRLNRVEYNNTIRDLVGVDFKPAADFPSDDVGNGFDNQSDVLTLPPLLMEKYLDAAEQIAEKAIVYDIESKLVDHKDGGRLPSQGEVDRRFDFKQGEYILRAEVQADQAGDELAKAEFRFDGKPLQVFEVQGQDQPNVFQFVLNVEQAGEKKFAVAFLNDFYDPQAEDKRQRDRNLDVNWLEVQGPKGATPDLPESHTRIITTTPRDGKSVRQAAEEIFTAFTSRAYRRPADPVEVGRLANLVEMAAGQGLSFEQAVAYGVQAVLVSPHFLFRVEDDVKPAGDGKVALADYELASRLSYFLWSSMPDEELFELAARGELSKPDVLAAQVKRMLDDEKSDALVENFFGQWLNLRNLDEISPDDDEYPWWNTQLKTAMRTETQLFCEAIVDDDRSILDVIDADFSFVNPRLAELYGIKWKDQDPEELYYAYSGPNKNDGDYRGNRRSGYYEHENEFVRVSLPSNRRGVLTQASVLTLTSNPAETSPVKRGLWIMANLLGTPPPPAPPGVPSFDEAKKSKPDATLREQLALHRSDPGCASCHNVMDPLGLGFENFNVIGQWRDKDGKFEIDPSGKLGEGEEFEGAIELIGLLKERDDQIARNFIEKLMTYGLGRGLEPYDRCAVDAACEAAKKDDYRFSTIVTAIVESDPFRMRRGEGAEP